MLFLIVLKLDENIEVGKSVSVPTAFWNWGYIWSYSIFLYSQCIAAYRGPHHFRGNRPNFGGIKPSAECKWECCQCNIIFR